MVKKMRKVVSDFSTDQTLTTAFKEISHKKVMKIKKEKLNENTRGIIFSFFGIQDFINKVLRLSKEERKHQIKVS